jgi:LysM repeat protein
MADRVKYFLLGVLFLVVAGVIAYDRWNSAGEPRNDVARQENDDTGTDVSMAIVPRPDPLSVPPSDPDAEKLPDPGPAVTPAPKPVIPDPVRVEQKPPRVEEKPAPPAPDKTHVVKKGETLEAIAIKYYGSRDGIEWIADANRLGNRNRILANQKLIIPAKKEIVKEGGSGGTAAKKTTTKIPSRYTMKDGDGDLYAICRKLYGRDGLPARVAKVMELNHLYSRDVKVGTVLILPAR